jgi:hypothetical protein
VVSPEKPDISFGVAVPLTREQHREISLRAGLGPFDGRALGEYIAGLLIGESKAELLERVHQIRDAERARFRAEIVAQRAGRERRRAELNRARTKRE